jgi:sugar phosphate isomerase/epimerase
MRFGLVTYNWGKDWDLPTLLKNCAAAKCDGVELRTTHKHGVEPTLNEKERAEVLKRFADSPVEFVGIGSACEYHSPDPAALRKQIDETKAFIVLAHDLGGSGVKVRPNGLPKEVPVDKTIAQIGRSLSQVAEFGAGYGIEIRVEVHGNGTAEIPVFKKIMDAADNSNVRVCWNCNASDLDGGLEHHFNLLKARFGATLHMHDLRTRTYPWDELFKLLKKADYQGWTLLEEGPIPKDIVAAIKENREIWDKLTK